VIAKTALELEAQILRSGGRLLHDLLRRNVYSDMAEAAHQAAQSLDPVQGNANAWGYESADGRALYGTISHAARVLLGRWEIGDTADFGVNADPQCEGAPEAALLPRKFGDDRTARTLDRSIRTPGERLAAQLVERAGLVVPASELPSDPSQPTDLLRAALKAQLLLVETAQNNTPTSPGATSLTTVLDTLSPADLAFGFRRSLNTWRLLTNTDDTSGNASASDAGVGCAPVGDPSLFGLNTLKDKSGNPIVAKEVTAVCGVVIAGGIARSRVATDPMARAGGMMAASQPRFRSIPAPGVMRS
jgi:hypothetical protein